VKTEGEKKGLGKGYPVVVTGGRKHVSGRNKGKHFNARGGEKKEGREEKIKGSEARKGGRTQRGMDGGRIHTLTGRVDGGGKEPRGSKEQANGRTASVGQWKRKTKKRKVGAKRRGGK